MNAPQNNVTDKARIRASVIPASTYLRKVAFKNIFYCSYDDYEKENLKYLCLGVVLMLKKVSCSLSLIWQA